jgi:hypothetical protein
VLRYFWDGDGYPGDGYHLVAVVPDGMINHPVRGIYASVESYREEAERLLGNDYEIKIEPE